MSFGYRNYILSNYTASSSYVNTPTYTPYTHQYPSIVSNLNNGTLYGLRPTPAEFSIMETANDYSSARQTYTRIFHPRSIPIKGKCLTPMTSAESIYLKKVASIGKSSLKTTPGIYSNKCPDKNYVATQLRRTRSSGCVPPKKCGSIYNRQSTPVNAFTQSSYF